MTTFEQLIIRIKEVNKKTEEVKREQDDLLAEIKIMQEKLYCGV